VKPMQMRQAIYARPKRLCVTATYRLFNPRLLAREQLDLPRGIAFILATPCPAGTPRMGLYS
jgi:hypothetical protein